MAIVEVTGVSVSVGRFFIEVDSAIAGNWVLLEGVDGENINNNNNNYYCKNYNYKKVL